MRSDFVIPGLERADVGADGTRAGLELALERMRLGEQRFKNQPVCERCRKQPSAIVRSINGAQQALCRGCSSSPSPAPLARSAAPAAAPLKASPAPAVVAKPAQRAEQLTGYVVVWGDEIRRDVGDRNHCGIAWPYGEAFAPYAFRHFLASKPDIIVRINHHDLIGRTADGSLELVENDYGLAFTLRPYNSGDGERAILCGRAGSIRGMSPTWVRETCALNGRSYRGADYAWSTPSMRFRQIVRSELAEISIVIGTERPSFQEGWAGLATSSRDGITNAQRVRDQAAAAARFRRSA